MNYLTRLAAQTGLVSELPGVAPQPAGIEEIEVAVSPPVPVPEPEGGRGGRMSADPAETASEVEIALPLSGAPPHVPPDPGEPAPGPISAPLDEDATARDEPLTDAQTPESADAGASREILLRHVMEWVASNEPVQSPPPARPVPVPAPDQPELRPSDPGDPGDPGTYPSEPGEDVSPEAGAEIPSLEINASDAVPATGPAPDSEARVSLPIQGPDPAPAVVTPRTVPQPSATDRPAILEETIEISIGAIHLEVTPPPGRVPHVPAQTAPAPAPAPARPASSSRLARRFIRV